MTNLKYVVIHVAHAKQRRETTKLTGGRHSCARVKVFEQTNLGRVLVLQVVPFISTTVLGIHCAADVVPSYQIDTEEIVVGHR